MVNTSKLQAKLLENGLTQIQLAEKMGISERSLNSKIQNRRSFTLPEIKNICDILEFTKEDLFAIFFN